MGTEAQVAELFKVLREQETRAGERHTEVVSIITEQKTELKNHKEDKSVHNIPPCKGFQDHIKQHETAAQNKATKGNLRIGHYLQVIAVVVAAVAAVLSYVK